MMQEKSTIYIATINSIPILIPNDIIFEYSNPVVYNNKEYNGLYISYNNHDIDIYGSSTTAIILGQMQLYLILNGNHTEQLLKAIDELGISSCFEYYKRHVEEINRYSEVQYR